MWTTKLINSLNKGQYQVINDSKTPSGRVHVGSLRGVLIHDAVYRELQSQGLPGIYIYGVDDYDPMDGLPADAPDSVREHMGKPLCNTPAPQGSTATDMADHYISEFLQVFRELDVAAQVYRMRDVYRGGLFNEAIHTILTNSHKVRAIYESISGAKRPDHWHPFQVICEKCGKIGTTEVSAFDGEKVQYHCKPDLVTWASGCGHKGEISPFDGNGKLPWKLEWAAKWHEFGITIEGAGKDHCTKGGSRDVATRILREVFGEQPPLNIPYEFFLVQGAKMSSSKGVGSSARDMADFLPPEILRFLMVKTDPKKAVNFSTDGAYMLKTFNEHDRLLEGLTQGKANEEQISLLRVTEPNFSPDSPPSAYAPISFQLITSLLQIPHVDLRESLHARMGRALTPEENHHLEARIAAASYWLNHIAQEEDKFEIQDTLPQIASENSPAQDYFIVSLLGRLASGDWTEEALQSAIFDTARLTPLPAKQAFEAIYRLFLAKENGPRAGALLSYLEPEFVMERLACISYSPIFFIASTGIPVDAFIQQLEAGKFAGTIVEIVPEVYLCTASEASFDDKEKEKLGFCVLNILSQDKNRLFSTRMVVSQFAGYQTVDEICSQFESKVQIFHDHIVGSEISMSEVRVGEMAIEAEFGEEKLQLLWSAGKK